jgi:hypothetical protein
MTASSGAPFPIEETTIAALHAAYVSSGATAVSVCQAHLDRIAAYDRIGPALGAIISINSDALADAAALDAALKSTGKLVGPLHGVPVLVKDNYDVAGLQTTGGAAALLGWIPETDATVIAKIKAAGGIILAKTTMSELARGGPDNINSVLSGFARNPYNTAYATGGSSGGTGSGLAASFGVVGLGSDTFGSIRNPASNNAVVGLRPSWGLVSRTGMIGLCDQRDVAGPMAHPIQTNIPHLADGTTNLHVHGVEVSPRPCHDEVLRSTLYAANWGGSIAPLLRCQDAPNELTYSYDIPSDHPAGLYFYHTHRHGQAQAQTMMGASGPIVIESEDDALREAYGVTDDVMIIRDFPSSYVSGEPVLSNHQAPGAAAAVGPRFRRAHEPIVELTHNAVTLITSDPAIVSIPLGSSRSP